MTPGATLGCADRREVARQNQAVDAALTEIVNDLVAQGYTAAIVAGSTLGLGLRSYRSLWGRAAQIVLLEKLLEIERAAAELDATDHPVQ